MTSPSSSVPGWAPAAAEIGAPTAVVPMGELPGFTPPTAAGTRRRRPLGTNGGSSRTGVPSAEFTHTKVMTCAMSCIRCARACAAGAHTVVLTNAAGGLRADFTVGQPVLINDHLNLTARSPLVGAQFVDLVDAYSPRLRALAREVEPDLAEGVYAWVPGPHDEIPAEIRMLRGLGADLVGMSTVHEAIAPAPPAPRCSAVSLVTNARRGYDRTAAGSRRGVGRGPSVGDADGFSARVGDFPALMPVVAFGESDQLCGPVSGAVNSISNTRKTWAAMMNVTPEPVSTAMASTA